MNDNPSPIDELLDDQASDIKSKYTFIRKLASQIAYKSSSSIPIQLKQVCEYVQKREKIEFHFRRLHLSDALSGQLIIGGKVVGVVCNKSHSVTRQRFTVAHEIGHLLLKHEFPLEKIEEIIDLGSNNPIEKEANIFASELLMPSKYLRKELKDNNHTLKTISELFNVSDQAMLYHLHNTRLIKHILVE